MVLVVYIKEAWKTRKFGLSDVWRNRPCNQLTRSTVPTRRLSNFLVLLGNTESANVQQRWNGLLGDDDGGLNRQCWPGYASRLRASMPVRRRHEAGYTASAQSRRAFTHFSTVFRDMKGSPEINGARRISRQFPSTGFAYRPPSNQGLKHDNAGFSAIRRALFFLVGRIPHLGLGGQIETGLGRGNV
jgi:hypothetical protein